jgi:hypothetical protein
MEYNPIFVASTGRAGSSLMMKILAAHPEIIVRSLFPYEARSYQYAYIHSIEQKNVANLPYINWEGIEYRLFQGNDQESLAWSQQLKLEKGFQLPLDLVDKYYHFVSQVEEKTEAKFFAEKLVGLPLVKKIITTINNYKIVFIQRDPRDTFFSIKSFNKKRGFLSFGEGQGDKNLFANLVSYYKICEQFKQKLTPDKYIDVKYEQIIANKITQTAKLYSQLEVGSGDREILRAIKYAFAESPESLEHKTSSDIQSSLSRWKQEADQSTLDLFATYQEDLVQMGYG